jgi:hypothetical protein
MSARRLRPAIVAILALVVTVGTLAACSRKSQPESTADDTTQTTAAIGTAIPPTTPDTSTSSTAPLDPSASSTTLGGDGSNAFGHTEEETAAFVAAYSEAFETECARIWASVGGGVLSDPDFPEDGYVVDDCLSELDPDWGELVDSIDEARTTGADDAQIAASDLADPLCAADGTTCWSYGD